MSQLVTADAVVLDLRPARVPTRMLATAVDLVMVALIAYGTSRIADAVGGSPARQAGAASAAALIFSFGYLTAMETLNRGRTIGAMALGLQAVRDDGGALSFRQALVRALSFWMVDFAPWTGLCGGLVCAAGNAQGKRIGDLLAGTMVVRTRAPRRPAEPELPRSTQLRAWAREAELSGLDDQLTGAARVFVSRARELSDYPRQQLAAELARQLGARVAPAPPLGTSPMDFLTMVVAERRRRETERVVRGTWVPSAEQLPSGWR